MGSTLEHGIYLPSEGEKNCYQGLAGNWNKVDGALGDVAQLKQSIESKFTKEIVTELPTEDINPYCIYMILKTDPETDNIYDEWVYINNAWEYLGNTKVDMTQYYTKQEVNELPAVASGVTSTKVGNYDTHLADSNIHVTSADKTKWNTVALIKQLRLVNTQVGSATTIAFANIDDTNGIKVGDKCMDLDAKLFEITAVDTTNQTVTVGTALIDIAIDSGVMHLEGNETVGGFKTFDRYIQCNGGYIGTEFSNNARTEFILRSNRDTSGQSGVCISKFRQNRAQGSMSGTDTVQVSFDVLENSVRTNRLWYLNWLDWENDIPKTVELRSFCQKVDYRLTHINGLTPSSLGMPDLANGIDISSYLTAGNSNNTYTPSVNGWISISLGASSGGLAIFLEQGDMKASSYSNTVKYQDTNMSCFAYLPVVAGVVVNIGLKGSNYINSAKFFPCLGNV